MRHGRVKTKSARLLFGLCNFRVALFLLLLIPQLSYSFPEQTSDTFRTCYAGSFAWKKSNAAKACTELFGGAVTGFNQTGDGSGFCTSAADGENYGSGCYKGSCGVGNHLNDNTQGCEVDSCPDGEVFDSLLGMCISEKASCDSLAGDVALDGYLSFDNLENPPVHVCQDECGALFEGETFSYLDGGVRKYYQEGLFRYQDANPHIEESGACEQSNSILEAFQPLNSCESPSVLFTVDGIPQCINSETGEIQNDSPVESSTSSSVTSNTDDGDGNTSSITTTTTTNSDGSKSVSITGTGTTNNSDGTKTVTDTVTETDSAGNKSETVTVTELDSDGKVTSVETSDDTNKQATQDNDISTFCEVNPLALICLESTYADKGCDSPPVCQGDAIQCSIAGKLWVIDCNMEVELQASGDCSSPPVCNGDPIGCLMVQQSFEERCAWDTADIQVSQATIDDGLGTKQTLEEFSAGEEIDVSDPIDEYQANNYGKCPADVSVKLAFLKTNINFSYSLICEFVDVIRIFVLLSAYFTSAMLFYNSFFTGRGI